MKPTKEIPFSQARQRLSAVVDQVEKTGSPVKILRHGKVAAVLIGVDEYRRKFERNATWKLAGSLTPVKGVNLEKALEDLSRQNARSRGRGARGLQED